MLNASAVACIEQVQLGFVASVTSGGGRLCRRKEPLLFWNSGTLCCNDGSWIGVCI